MFDGNVQSPLAEITAQENIGVAFNAVTVEQLHLLEHFNVRLQADDEALLGRLQQVLDMAVPQQPNSFVIHENVLWAWLEPDEWLLISPPDRADHIEKDIRAALTGQFATLVKISSAQTIFRISGDRAADFLSRGIAIDLDPMGFSTGQCAQTEMAHVPVLVLNQTQDEPRLDLIVRRSFADHLWRWLLDIGEEAEFRR